MHVVPATHCVSPVHPIPPHCPHFGTVSELVAELVAGAAVVIVVVFVAVAVGVAVGVVPVLVLLSIQFRIAPGKKILTRSPKR